LRLKNDESNEACLVTRHPRPGPAARTRGVLVSDTLCAPGARCQSRMLMAGRKNASKTVSGVDNRPDGDQGIGGSAGTGERHPKMNPLSLRGRVAEGRVRAVGSEEGFGNGAMVACG